MALASCDPAAGRGEGSPHRAARRGSGRVSAQPRPSLLHPADPTAVRGRKGGNHGSGVTPLQGSYSAFTARAYRPGMRACVALVALGVGVLIGVALIAPTGTGAAPGPAAASVKALQ